MKKQKTDYKTDSTPRAITRDGLPVFCAFDALVDVQRVLPNPLNPNTHDPVQVKALGDIIRATGWRQPLTISALTGPLVKGHGRRLAALKIGATEVPVEYQEYSSEDEEHADLLADNRLAELATLDEQMLADLLRQIENVPVELTGFTAAEVDALYNAITGEDDAKAKDLDAVPSPPGAPVTRPGDIWRLGKHRLVCGDATDAKAAGRLMRSEKAQLVHTDPPYGVAYETQSGRFEQMANDDLSGDALLRALLQPAFQLYTAYTAPNAAFYVWHASSTRREFEDALRAVGLIEKQYLIWAKPAPVLGHADYQWAHEPCFYMEKAGQHAAFYGDRAQRTVWKATLQTAEGLATTLIGGLVITDGAGQTLYLQDKVPKGKKLRYVRLPEGRSITLSQENRADSLWEVSRETKTIHATQKPVELVLRALENSSQPGDLVLDFFAGSGSTLVGAEISGRRCYAMELDPGNCDRIVRRYMDLTECGDDAITVERDGWELTYAEAVDADAE